MFFVLKYILLLIIPVLLIPSFTTEFAVQPVYPTTGLSLCVITQSNSDTVTINGTTDYVSIDITFKVTSPSGNNVVAIGEISPQIDGDYNAEFNVGPAWSEDGFYTITVMQSLHQNSLHTLSAHIEVNNIKTSETDICINSYHPIEPESISITTNQQSYHTGETILVSGQLTNPHNGTSISIMLELPNGTLSPIHNIIRNSTNHFNTTIPTGNNTSISTHGTYLLTAHYNNSTANTTFDYATLQEEESYHNSSYLTLSDHEIAKWNNTLQQWQHAQNVTDNQTELYYEKLDRAISRNQTNQIELFTERIDHSLALSSLYDGIIECLQEQLDLLS